MIPVPIELALLACDATTLIPFGPAVSRERVLGLAGAAPMDSAGDLAALGLQLRDPQSALAQTRVAQRRSIAEAAAMLAYVTGRQTRSPGAIIRLARKLVQDPASRVALPRIALRWPGLLRLFEPMRPSMRHGLCRRLHLAAMVAESEDADLRKSGFGAVAAQLILEIAVAPLRVLLARVYA
jgi:NADH dehydrogenase